MAPVCITRKVRFAAAHYFYLPEYSEAENFQQFGKSANRHGHGHNYEVEVAVEGELNPETGMVINLTQLKSLLNEEVVEPLDFKNLNQEVPFFKDRLPSLESLVLYIWNRLEPRLNARHLKLIWVKIAEDDDLYATYFGEAINAPNFENAP